jgi:hypothetical protein
MYTVLSMQTIVWSLGEFCTLAICKNVEVMSLGRLETARPGSERHQWIQARQARHWKTSSAGCDWFSTVERRGGISWASSAFLDLEVGWLRPAGLAVYFAILSSVFAVRIKPVISIF